MHDCMTYGEVFPAAEPVCASIFGSRRPQWHSERRAFIIFLTEIPVDAARSPRAAPPIFIKGTTLKRFLLVGLFALSVATLSIPVAFAAPFELHKGDHIGIVGNTLA